MSDFKWKISSIENGEKKYNTTRLLDNLDGQLYVLNEACRFGEVDSIVINYASGPSIMFEIHRKVSVESER